MTYADKTEVSPERSRAEIEQTLARYGADSFAYMSSPDGGMIAFRYNGRNVRFEVHNPDVDGFRRTPKGRERGPADARRAWEGELRRLWRCLALCVKAKLEAVESGIVTFDDEFLAHFVLPTGATVAQEVGDQIELMASSGAMPNFAGALTAGPSR